MALQPPDQCFCNHIAKVAREQSTLQAQVMGLPLSLCLAIVPWNHYDSICLMFSFLHYSLLRIKPSIVDAWSGDWRECDFSVHGLAFLLDLHIYQGNYDG